MTKPKSPHDANSLDIQRTAQLLREAEEALAQERLHGFWRDHGKTVLACALMLVVGTAAGNGWRYFKTQQNGKKTDALVMLTSQAPNAQKTTPDLKMLGGQQAALAALILADQAGSDAKLSSTDKQKNILAALNQVPESTNKDVWNWLITWSKLRLPMDDPKNQPNDLIASLQKLVNVKKDSPLSVLPLIDIALIQGERLNDYNAALATLLTAEQNSTSAPSLANMVTELQRIYGVAAMGSAKPAGDKK